MLVTTQIARRIARAVALAATAAAALAAAHALPPLIAGGTAFPGDEAEIVLKDGRRIQGTILQELDSRIKIETPTREVMSIDRDDIEEILRPPNTDSRVIDILDGIERLLAGQEEILERLPKEGSEPPRGAARAEGVERRPAAAEAGVAATAERLRAALGEPVSIVRDCFEGSEAAGANPFPSEKWLYAAGATGLRADERRAVYVVNGTFVGSIIESSGGSLRPDTTLASELERSRR